MIVGYRTLSVYNQSLIPDKNAYIYVSRYQAATT